MTNGAFTPPPAPRVSVIVATYRGGEYLRQTIASVLAQTCGDFELLVADDGNHAETRTIATVPGDPRILYHANAQTLGPAGNHWAAMRRARGEYLAILNHDDLWKPDFLSQLLAGFQMDARVVVAFCDHEVIDPQGHVLPEETARLSQTAGRTALAPGLHLPFADLAMSCAIPAAQAAVFKRSALDLDALPAEAGPAYDLWLNHLLARTGGGAWYVSARLAGWRTHPASISTAPARSDWPAGAAACWQQMAEDPLYAPSRAAARRQAVRCYVAAALADLRGGRRPAARRHAAQAVALEPFSLRAAAAFVLTLLPAWLQRRFVK